MNKSTVILRTGASLKHTRLMVALIAALSKQGVTVERGIPTATTDSNRRTSKADRKRNKRDRWK